MKYTAIMSLEQAVQAARKRVLTGGVAAGLLVTGLGVAALFAPLLLGWSLAVILMIGFALYGAAQLAAFLETAKGQRSPWTLIGGLTLIAFAGTALWAAFSSPGGAALLIASLTNFVAFFTVIQGVSQLILFDEMRRSRLPGAGWMLAGGILNAVAGNLLVMQPLTGWLAVSTIWGIYLIGTGLALAADSLSNHRGRYIDA